ncbi:MAG: FAD-binding oxidoreductase [Alphaproteobacteria bacterium]
MSQPSCVVVGAGIVGASIAWHLAAAGTRVTVVDAGGPGGVATPCSFAWINATFGNPEPYFRLRHRSMAEWRRLAGQVPGLPLAWSGGLRWDMSATDMGNYVAGHGDWGYPVRRVGRDEAARIEPSLAAPPDDAVYVAEEGAVEPDQAARLLLAEADLRQASVTGLVLAGGDVVGVETGDGRLKADHVVLAAGAATGDLAATAGVAMPVETLPGLLVHSRPYGKLLNGLVLAPGLHIRQTLDGRLVSGADYGGSDPGADPEAEARTVFARMKAALRGAEDLEFERFSVGHRPIPVDHFPAVGPAPGVGGLYLAVMHSGITLAPAVGRFAAEEIVHGREEPLLSPFRPARFAQAAA